MAMSMLGPVTIPHSLLSRISNDSTKIYKASFKTPSNADRQVPPVIYRCDLCNISFNSQDDLSGHAKGNH